MYKLKTIAKNAHDLSIGFDRYRGRRLDQIFFNKNIKGYHVSILLNYVFGIAEIKKKLFMALVKD